MKYAIVIQKMTRDKLIVSTGNELEEAIIEAARIYDYGLLYVKHKTLASGVSVLVVREEQDWEKNFLDYRVYQCGGM